METISNEFGEMRLVEPHLVEMIAKKGVEITPEIVEYCYGCGFELCGGPCAFLVNRINDYSLTYAATQKVADNPDILALAYLTHSDSSEQVAQYNARLACHARCPVHVFRDRKDALAWLHEKISAHESTHGHNQQQC